MEYCPPDAKACQLALLKANLEQHTYPGYPELPQRLVSELRFLGRSALGHLILPEGPWSVNTHPKRRDTATIPTHKEQQALHARGLETDDLGRPLHPWFRDMLTDPAIGVVTGKGAYFSWGPNYTADAIVIKDGRVLLIQRQDTGQWALPGGFVDHNETALEAVKREALEETTVALFAAQKPQLIYQGPVADIRATAHAWPETTAWLFKLDSDYPTADPHGMDDARTAAWVPLEAVSQEGILFGSHQYLLDQAVAKLH